MTIAVAKADTDCLGEVFPLLEAYLKEIGEGALAPNARERLRSAVERGDIVFFLARAEEEHVGLCSITIAFSTYKASPLAIFEDYFVVPAHRGTGTARRLVEAACAYAAEHGCASLLVGCADTDVDLWSHFGFVRLANLMAKDL